MTAPSHNAENPLRLLPFFRIDMNLRCRLFPTAGVRTKARPPQLAGGPGVWPRPGDPHPRLAPRRGVRHFRRDRGAGHDLQPGVFRRLPPIQAPGEPRAGAARLLRFSHVPEDRHGRLAPHCVGRVIWQRGHCHHFGVQSIATLARTVADEGIYAKKER